MDHSYKELDDCEFRILFNRFASGCTAVWNTEILVHKITSFEHLSPYSLNSDTESKKCIYPKSSDNLWIGTSLAKASQFSDGRKNISESN